MREWRAGFFIFMVILGQIPNHSPIVRIVQPLDQSSYLRNSQVPYAVEVSDKEDGESKFQEIPSSEVLVRLKYVENSVLAISYLNQKKFSDTSGIMGMLVSNCFNCHGFKTKLTGPSFQDISKKYPHNDSSREKLKNHILKGSTGIWGKDVMPTHPELTNDITQKMVNWIFRYANDPTLNYFIGLEGLLPLNQSAVTGHPGVFVMTAFYTDHGTLDFPDKHNTGSSQVILKMK